MIRIGCSAVLVTFVCAIAHQPGLCQNAAPAQGPPALSTSADPIPRSISSSARPAEDRQSTGKQPVESELIVDGAGSFGHYHLLANSWWSELYWGSVEYDRHSWGRFLKAQMDYSAAIQPVMFLKQPSLSNVYGIPLTRNLELVPGIGIAPIGLRMMWRSGKAWKPYLLMRGGLVGFTKKALSQDGSYANLSLQVGIGVQFHVKDRIDMRVGFSDFHFSDAFIVPSNPGLDVMAYSAGLSYHLGKRKQ